MLRYTSSVKVSLRGSATSMVVGVAGVGCCVVSGLERWLQAERRKESYWRVSERKNQRRVKNKNEDQPEKGEKKKEGEQETRR